MNHFPQLLVRWSEADVQATAYWLTRRDSRHPEQRFLAEQLRQVAQVWFDAVQLEARHIQQRMPRAPREADGR